MLVDRFISTLPPPEQGMLFLLFIVLLVSYILKAEN